jgi:restriction system protein
MRYVAEIKHLGLGTYRVLKDLDNYRLSQKVEAQFNKWDEQWAKISHKNKTLAEKEASLSIAEERTREAQEKQKQIEDLLIYTLDIDDTVNWNSLKDTKKFKIPNPKSKLETELERITPPPFPDYRELPIEPYKGDYDPKLSLVDKIFKSRKENKINQADFLYQESIKAWQSSVLETDSFNATLKEQYELNLKEFEEQKQALRDRFDTLEKDWEKEKEVYHNNQTEHNIRIETLKESYFHKTTEAIIQYCEIVLNNSQYPDAFPKDFDLDYNSDNKILIVEYVLPSPDDLPSLTEVKYIVAKKELKELFLSETQLSKNFDSAIYKITLRTIHELFEADKAEALDAVIFNGWVNAVNKATGKRVNNCIVTVQAKKTEFLEIELSNVEPKTCFKNLKGIGSSKLSGITAVQPIAQISKNDKRFITSHEVANQLNQGFNLAAMDWQEFEHLIRELFEKEFSTNGGEVKVTQASRDGGVDAVAFDPDPIRGGKIVIQAKRYTNTVGVSAVRDLYGTVMNEGATKGILVSTADYGPDAYEFAKNKPLTLMNGGNLLYLLEKHGHKARIDLAEAKKILGENLI